MPLPLRPGAQSASRLLFTHVADQKPTPEVLGGILDAVIIDRMR